MKKNILPTLRMICCGGRGYCVGDTGALKLITTSNCSVRDPTNLGENDGANWLTGDPQRTNDNGNYDNVCTDK